MKNVNVTLEANQCRSIDWLSQNYSEAPPSGQNYCRLISSVKVNVTELKTFNTNAVQKPQILMYKNLPVLNLVLRTTKMTPVKPQISKL